MRIFRPLDRYILGAFLRVFMVTALGFPLIVIVMDATEKLGKYIDQKIPTAKIALSYVYYIPESLGFVLPAAVLFATVFTIGSLTRHSEVTAAKASGISFYRLIAPLGVGALIATMIGLVVQDIVPVTTARRNDILGAKAQAGAGQRYSFAYSADNGRVYTIGQLNAHAPATVSGPHEQVTGFEINQRGKAPYPTVVTMASSAEWMPGRWWFLHEGVMHIVSPDSNVLSVKFFRMRDYHLTESPVDLLQQTQTAPDEMQWKELTRYLRAMQRSGTDVNPSRVDRMLRIAIPATCLIIFLFGAPLATSNQRGGAAFGIGIALATTVLFLMLVQLTKAIGGKGLLTPELAAWIPSMVFGAAGLVLLARVRT